MTREQLIVFLEKNNSITVKQIRAHLKEHDSHLVSHEVQVEVFANRSSHINLILFHYKLQPGGGIGLYKSEPILMEWEGKEVKLCSFPPPPPEKLNG